MISKFFNNMANLNYFIFLLVVFLELLPKMLSYHTFYTHGKYNYSNKVKY